MCVCVCCLRFPDAALVNNLDLQVKAEGLGNKLLLGNVYANNYMNPENKTQLGDNVNNVESVSDTCTHAASIRMDQHTLMSQGVFLRAWV